MPTTKKSSSAKSKSSKSTGSKSGSKSSAAKSRSTKSPASKSGASRPAGAKSSTSKSKSSAAKSSTSKAKSSAAKSTKGSSSSRSLGKKRTAAKSSSSTGSKSGASRAKSSTGAAKSTRSSTNAKPSSRRTTAKRSRSASAKRNTGNDGKGLISAAVDAVAGLFGNGKNNAVDLLKTDHRKVEDLFARIKENEDGNNAPTFKKIKSELDVHAHIEETIFYPHLLDRGDKELKKIVREGFEEHAQVKDLLVEIAGLPGDSPTFKAKLKVLMENVEHHVEEEEDEMFSMVEDQIPEDTRVRLGSLMQGEKVKVNKMTPAARGQKASAAGQR